MKKIIATLLLMTFPVSLFAGEVITVKGSDTMVILAQRWAETYMKKNPNVTIQVTGGGSGTGISALINGTTDVCNASRPMKPAEKQKLKQRFSTLGVEIKAAKDGIALYVHESNPVQELTLKQVKEIYTGKITNWKQVGGADARIILYSRENNSGTYVYFKDVVLEAQDYAPNCQNMPGTAAVVNAVAKDPNGIGYGGAAYGKGIRDLKIKADENSPAYIPNAETVGNGTYPITRFLYMYVKSRPTGAMKEYVDWILSDDGQSIVSRVGYFPLR
jgi:phosphate transport system substrate-binding protein